MSGTHIRFGDSEDEFQASNSEDELSDSDKARLKKARNKGAAFSDSEDEVYGVHSESEQSDIALSDVEGQGEDDDGIPDPKAWGRNKKNYYSTDYVDPDYGGFQGKDATMAELEEEEARKLQTELAKNMDDDDFTFFLPKKDKKDDQAVVEEIIQTDVSLLSKRQKLKLLEKDSPEFFGLVKDFEDKMAVVRDYLHPIITLQKEGKLKDGIAMKFVTTYNELILNYCTNIYMYLLLKANKTNVQSHPLIKRLFQYRQFLLQMDPVFNDVIKSQLEVLIEEYSGDQNVSVKSKKKKTLKLLSQLAKANDKNANGLDELNNKKEKRKHSNKQLDDSGDSDDEQPKKKQKGILKTGASAMEVGKSVKFGENNCGLAANSDTSDEGEEQEGGDDAEAIGEDEGGEVGKRRITYQIAKNKGLTPHRKKEQRNPRVKHRNKFRKAKIRRKGAVREVRTETSRYGGEISGIKSTVSKSIKIKS